MPLVLLLDVLDGDAVGIGVQLRAAPSPRVQRVLGEPEAEHLASAGRAAPGVDVRIVGDDGAELPTGETGEIAVRSDFIMSRFQLPSFALWPIVAVALGATGPAR